MKGHTQQCWLQQAKNIHSDNKVGIMKTDSFHDANFDVTLKSLKMILQWGTLLNHDDVIKWKHFPHYWLFLQGIHRSPMNSPHKGQWHGALMFSLICAWINGWGNIREAGDLRRHHAHYGLIVMKTVQFNTIILTPPDWPNDQIRT